MSCPLFEALKIFIECIESSYVYVKHRSFQSILLQVLYDGQIDNIIGYLSQTSKVRASSYYFHSQKRISYCGEY